MAASSLQNHGQQCSLRLGEAGAKAYSVTNPVREAILGLSHAHWHTQINCPAMLPELISHRQFVHSVYTSLATSQRLSPIGVWEWWSGPAESIRTAHRTVSRIHHRFPATLFHHHKNDSSVDIYVPSYFFFRFYVLCGFQRHLIVLGG